MGTHRESAPGPFMRRALELAWQGLGQTSPNPSVGAVVVREGRVVAEGVTSPPGGPHAEVTALARAGPLARGSALYVTLEPCAHHGRTPPCTQAIIAAGVAEVHMALLDPNPLVNGRGREALESAGVRCYLGEGAEEARRVMEGYFKWVGAGLPFVTLKWAVSLDGKSATATGHSRWISGPTSRRYAHLLRARADAVMVGVGTVLADDPLLTARGEDDRPLPRQPLRVVVDSGARTPASARLLRQPGPTLIAVARPPGERLAPLEAAGARVLPFPAEDGRVDLRALLRHLAREGATSVLVEGGGTLAASLLAQGLVDKVVAFIAPVIVGGKEAPTPVEGEGIPTMEKALRLERLTVERLGQDLVLTGYIGGASSGTGGGVLVAPGT